MKDVRIVGIANGRSIANEVRLLLCHPTCVLHLSNTILLNRRMAMTGKVLHDA